MNSYTSGIMQKYTPPTAKCPVTFYYSNDNTSFAVYGANGLQLFGCMYGDDGLCTSATLYDNHGQLPYTRNFKAAGQPWAVINAGPFAGLSSALGALITPDPSAAKAPPGMHVFHPPLLGDLCPFGLAYWLPTGGSIGIGFMFFGKLMCYRVCTINPADHSISMEQEVGALSCKITMSLNMDAGPLVAPSFRFEASLFNKPVFDTGALKAVKLA
jgi:hypothetical protein